MFVDKYVNPKLYIYIRNKFLTKNFLYVVSPTLRVPVIPRLQPRGFNQGE